MPKTISRSEEIRDQFLQLMQEHLAELFAGKAEKRFHAVDFASRMFISSIHLSNTILLTTGRSPCDFMEEALLTEAQRLLRETDMSIADIGYRFVYNEPSNFSKFFKGMCGLTPMQYRKKNTVSQQ